MSPSHDLLTTAELLDHFPEALINGGGQSARYALTQSAATGHDVAIERWGTSEAVDDLWVRATRVLSHEPGLDELYAVAANAACLLYTAAWCLDGSDVEIEDVRAVL